MKFKRTWTFGILLLAAVFVVSGALVYFGVRSLGASRGGAVHQAEVHTQNLAQAIDLTISAEIRHIDQSLVTVTSEMERSLASGRLDLARMSQFLSLQEKLLPGAVAIRVSNAEGTVILNNPSTEPTANFRERPFWAPLRDHPEAGLLITKPIVGMFTKQWMMHFARRYNLPDGRFGGVVVAPVLVDQLQRALCGFDVGTGGRLTLRDDENGYVTRYPLVVKGKTLGVGDKEIASELQAIVASGIQQKTYSAVTPYDQMKREFTFRRLQGIPLYVVASLAEEDYLTQWRLDRKTTFIRLGIAILGFCILAVFLWFFWLSLERDEAKLREAHQFNLQIIQCAKEGVIVYGPDLRYRVWNPFMERLSGVPAREVIGKHPLQVFPFLREVGVIDRLERVLAGEVVDSIEFPYEVEATGNSIWSTDTSAPLLSSTGEILGVIGVVSDITGRKKTEEELLASRQQYRNLVENTADLVTRVDLEGRLLFVNHAATGIWGLAPEACIGHSAFDFIAAEDRERTMTAFDAWMHGDSETLEFENRQVGLGGQVHTMAWLIQADRDGSGKITGFASSARDITERKKAEEALQQEQQFSKSVMDALPGIFYLYTYPGIELVLWNKQHESLLGYETGEMKGRLATDWFAPELREAVLKAIEGVMERGENAIEAPMTAKDGHQIPLLLTGVRFESQGRLYFVGTGTDLTERMLAEEEKNKLRAQLQQSQKMESLGTLAGGVAHDMNNVLGAILGLASAHIGTQPYGSPLHQALDTICKATERGGKMVKSLLSFARQNPAESHELDVNTILQEQVGLLERTTLAKVRIQLDLDTDLRPILGDLSALSHAFMNLCVNAVDAMPENGILTLHTRNVDSDWIEIVVEDTGIGMPKEILEKALDPFFTTKEVGKGTGLGLSMVFNTVKAHRGQMVLQSEPGHGTRVTLRFPACEKVAHPPVAAPAMTEDTATLHGTLNVLLVDDDELIQTSVQAILEVLGHTVVHTAQSGEEALKMLGAGLEPDLVILDMNMPGLGGAGTLPRLRALRSSVPVLLSTGRADQTALALVSAYPGVTLLSKPFGLRELQKHLENIGLG